jgi:hypothetical protein
MNTRISIASTRSTKRKIHRIQAEIGRLKRELSIVLCGTFPVKSDSGVKNGLKRLISAGVSQ